MALISGTRLGPYEILSAIGAGGMGEVYRASDTRLDRRVAIKILPPALADDPQFRERFDREARTISQLTHPNICTLYDVGEHDRTAFLVMELLDGQTLADRLKKGALPLAQALSAAIEVASALDAAHRAGIVHRDLKPGNIFLVRSGGASAPSAKLLDFGLAKASVPAIARADGSMLPTTPANLTVQGTILGTLPYMAPEQIEGREADARTDIWAFGCVLYEMISGVPAFAASTPASLIASILEREPARLRLDEAAVPQRLWDVIRTCLEKHPDDRWQSARDLAREIKWSATEAGQPAAGAAVPAGTSRRAWLLAAAGVLAAVVAAPWLSRRASEASAPAGPPVVVLMDSTHPERIYDDQTRKAGGTNADDLTDVLRDLPIVLLKENTNATWHREYQVLQEHPALIVAHRSCFYDATMLGDASRQLPFINLSWDKFEAFAGFIGQGSPRTRILAYSRGSWRDEAERAQWLASMEQRFPLLRGRLDAMRVPLDRATFRNPTTGAEIRQHVERLLNLASR